MLVLKDDHSVKVTGALIRTVAIQSISRFTDEGVPYLGLIVEAPEDLNEEILEIRGGSLVFVTENGEQYDGASVVDLRPDGSTVAYKRLPRRYVTPQIKAVWRTEVMGAKTLLSFDEWLEEISDREYLAAHGLYLTKRDWRINMDFEGEWQIAEFYQPGVETLNGDGAVRAIVGDDVHALVQEAINSFVAPLAE